MSLPNTDPAGTTPTTKAPGKLPKPPERDRLRDIIVVIVTYPLTPTKKTGLLAEKKPWLEFISLLLKVVLAAYAIYEAAGK
ncbi:hypothetical protein LEM8419_03297 [Neolewinella maritima]|uniref:Uncharacterized protein n=1 Tax=Neolewinella maritima TaxID=1383882 RepID=A0ABN8F8P2_9BACT|nr:hypothetical protein [Neolewinella maritima]CAH1002408.1 hypothetical protein LEM8419_03297 [Neolewinella maritima]